MAHTPVLLPHLVVPFRLDRSGSAATVDQDTPGEVAQSVRVLLGTRPGQRPVVPDYGVDDPTFEPAGDLVDGGWIEEVVTRWEPRATVDVVGRILAGDVDLTVTVNHDRG